MKTFKLASGNHELEIRASWWSGWEDVLYDARVVSEKRSFIFTTCHSFRVTEDGEEVTYEVEVLSGIGLGYIARRNGLVFSHHP
ncbi:MAG: hypothetical protein R3338_12580 [Thermoanaerobaculia bacterium]|nr:hypothetical protein [Thermoanaerobaculia bacterium]